MMALIFFAIHHFHIDHNAPPPPPPQKKIALTLFPISPGYYYQSREKSKPMVMYYFGVNKVHYGLCENGEFTASVGNIPYSLRHHYAV